MKKRTFYTEAAYVLGLCILAVGTALMSRGDFGVSMVVAPAYILHLKLSESFAFFSFGLAEYVLQALVLGALMLLMKKAKVGYLLSFANTVVYGILLDGCVALTALLPADSFALRLVIYILGDILCAAGIALLFYSYLPPAAYELFVKELARKKGIRLSVFKTAYDCASLLVSVVMTLTLFGSLQGIGIGTAVCALANGTLIRMFSTLFARVWDFRDRFSLRSHFEEREEML